MIRIAIIGASYLQVPLIRKAKNKGIETHVFSWQKGDEGELLADYYYPISIREKEKILCKCMDISIDGICTIASDLAVITVEYVAEKMGLVGNGIESSLLCTNKYLMRKCFDKNDIPSPYSLLINNYDEVSNYTLDYPIIVKPIDRSGSRGITKLETEDNLEEALKYALTEGFEKKALIEEYVVGNEYSIECISWQGIHQCLAVTKKYTSGAPYFIEIGHREPSGLDDNKLKYIKKVVFKALDSLKIRYGASHTELKIMPNGQLKIIEIGARMGGDHIGSMLVERSTGYDYVGAVIDIAIGNAPKNYNQTVVRSAGVRYILDDSDVIVYNMIKKDKMIKIVDVLLPEPCIIKRDRVKNSSDRYGYFIFESMDFKSIDKYMP